MKISIRASNIEVLVLDKNDNVALSYSVKEYELLANPIQLVEAFSDVLAAIAALNEPPPEAS